MTPPALSLPALERNPRSPHDPILADLAPGVYAFPAPFPGYVGRLVIVATPHGPRMASYAVLDAADVDAATDMAFAYWRAQREAEASRGRAWAHRRRRGPLRLLPDDQAAAG